jgi:hypothetical protein
MMTWGDVYWRYVRKGCDRSDAAYRADQWEKRQNPRRWLDCQ